MARETFSRVPDLSQPHELTIGLIERIRCPEGRLQAFMRDKKSPSLRVRVTANNAKSFVFEAKLQGKTIRRTIGNTRSWTIDAARAEANRLRVTLDCGVDPRDVDRQKAADAREREAAEAARFHAEKLAAITVRDVWNVYIEQRRPFWGDWHYRDHVDKARAGGEVSNKRGAKGALTKPGPLAPLMPLALKSITQDEVERWAADEGKLRPASARLAWRLLTVFLAWCAEQPEYSQILPAQNPAKTKKARESLGKPGVKTDVLQREQLKLWFTAVGAIANPCVSACLQVMLLTGARPGEVVGLRWDDVNWQWNGINIRDKVEGTREIPLTPYVKTLLESLPRRNDWVFSSRSSDSGRLSEPNTPHTRACRSVGITELTLHGLRRSFASLTEWLETPAGVVAQIQGHKPSATAEKHYKVRPLELLRVHHTAIENWILVNADWPAKVLSAKPKIAKARLRLVS
jgi:integrase